MKKKIGIGMLLILLLNIIGKSEELKSGANNQICSAWSSRRVSVHDPSITTVSVNGKKTYYIFGSHMGAAKSTDLKNWEERFSENPANNFFIDGSGKKCSFNDAYSYNKVRKVKNYQGRDVDWGTHNIPLYQGAVDRYGVAGNQWAPDIIYNPNMKKWCWYISLNGAKWNSVIALFTSNNIEGPYQYQGPIIYSGFNVVNDKRVDYKNTDLEIAIGTQNSLPNRYKVGGSWGTNWPHAIDPGVFFDGDQLWMNYGSWSGGIYIIKLDKNTGLRDYTVKYGSDYDTKKASVTTDAYFGKKIAGGYYVSGEGSYIEKIGKYFYLFMSYGFYSPDGGYEMRIFRSTRPDGPYTDYKNTNAIYGKYEMNYGPKATTNRGCKIIGGYKWPEMDRAELAQGHNSALMDDDGRAYIIYHIKFNDGSIFHEVRVHQLFVNSEGWLCASPHEFNPLNDDADINGKSKSNGYMKSNEIVGKYSMILHKYKMDYEKLAYNKPQDIVLENGGRVSGSMNGDWKMGKNAYVTINLNNVKYECVAVPGTMERKNIPAVCVTCMSSSTGQGLWLTKMSDKGKVCQQNQNQNQNQNTKNLVARYNWDNNWDNQVNNKQKANPSMLKNGKRPIIEKDNQRGLVLHQYFGFENGQSISYTSMTNPLKNQNFNAVTINIWVKREDNNTFDTLWSFTSGQFGKIKGRLFMTGNCYLGYNNGNGSWFDVNHPDKIVLNDIGVNSWTKLTVRIESSRFKIYINGKVKYTEKANKAYSSGGMNGYQSVLDFLKGADNMYLGYGSFWGSAPAKFDDLTVYSRALSDDEINSL